MKRKDICKALSRSLPLALFLATGMLGQRLQAQESAPPPSVVISSPVRMDGLAPRSYAGSIRAIERVDLVARVTGELRQRHFQEGAIVRKGDLLYTIEDTGYRATVASLQARRQQLMAAVDLAKAEYERSATLLEKEVVTESAHDKATYDYKSAQAGLAEVEAQLIDAENNLSYTTIHSPLTGRIGQSAFTVGNLIRPDLGPLANIEMLAPIYVRFSISEKTFRRDFGGLEGIGKQARVELRLADGTHYDEKAKVTLVDNKIDQHTNSITLWATFANADGALLPGSYVTVLLTPVAEGETYVAVETSAVLLDAESSYVLVLDQYDVAQRRQVKADGVVSGLTLIKEGLALNERIVIDGTHKVSPGMKVRPVWMDTEGKR